jgi:hypothetical protein
LIWQGFECSPFDHNETWTLSAAGSAGIDTGYTASPLAGLKSCRCVSNNIAQDITCPTFSAQDEVWAYFLMKAETLPSGGFEIIAAWLQSGSLNASVAVNPSGTLRISSSSVDSTVDAISAGTVYNVWFHFKSGTGSDGVLDVGFSTNGTRPTSGNKFVQVTGQTISGNLDAFKFMRFTGNPSRATYVFDNALVKTSQIGDSPP